MIFYLQSTIFISLDTKKKSSHYFLKLNELIIEKMIQQSKSYNPRQQQMDKQHENQSVADN